MIVHVACLVLHGLALVLVCGMCRPLYLHTLTFCKDKGSCEEEGLAFGLGLLYSDDMCTRQHGATDGHAMLRVSFIHADYIDEVFEGPSLWPSDPYKKAVDRLLVDEFGSKVYFLKLFLLFRVCRGSYLSSAVCPKLLQVLQRCSG